MTSLIQEVLQSQVAMSCIIAWFLSQMLKGILHTIAHRSFSLQHYLTGLGGMPSSHSAFVSSLFLSIYQIEGLSITFLLALAFGIITIRDAVGVRRATADHAKVLNMLIDRMIEPQHEQYMMLKELVGHTLLEVIIGLLIGVFSVYIVFSIW